MAEIADAIVAELLHVQDFEYDPYRQRLIDVFRRWAVDKQRERNGLHQELENQRRAADVANLTVAEVRQFADSIVEKWQKAEKIMQTRAQQWQEKLAAIRQLYAEVSAATKQQCEERLAANNQEWKERLVAIRQLYADISAATKPQSGERLADTEQRCDERLVVNKQRCAERLVATEQEWRERFVATERDADDVRQRLEEQLEDVNHNASQDREDAREHAEIMTQKLLKSDHNAEVLRSEFEEYRRRNPPPPPLPPADTAEDAGSEILFPLPWLPDHEVRYQPSAPNTGSEQFTQSADNLQTSIPDLSPPDVRALDEPGVNNDEPPPLPRSVSLPLEQPMLVDQLPVQSQSPVVPVPDVGDACSMPGIGLRDHEQSDINNDELPATHYCTGMMVISLFHILVGIINSLFLIVRYDEIQHVFDTFGRYGVGEFQRDELQQNELVFQKKVKQFMPVLQRQDASRGPGAIWKTGGNIVAASRLLQMEARWRAYWKEYLRSYQRGLLKSWKWKRRANLITLNVSNRVKVDTGAV